MALFYDYNVGLPSSSRQICSAWSETEAILAVGLDNREIQFFTDEVSSAMVLSLVPFLHVLICREINIQIRLSIVAVQTL
jgi:hypothetical protein